MTMRYALLIILLLEGFVLYAQPKLDANWVFGRNCGISFLDTTNPIPFYAIVASNESAMTISDSSGELLFYTGGTGPILFLTNEYLYDDNNNPILGSDTLNLDYQTTSGLSILPIGDDRFVLVQIYFDLSWNCGSGTCSRLVYSILRKESNSFVIERGNVSLSIPSTISNKLGVVKHANGKDWWIVVREHPLVNSCSNSIYTYLLQGDSIVETQLQHVGYQFCNSSDSYGEIIISEDGTTIAFCYGKSGVIDLLSFDRCNGELSQIDTINLPGLYPYGASFSPNGNNLYVTVTKDLSNRQGLYQIRLDSNKKYLAIDTLMLATNVTYSLGQLQLAPDNKIYMSTLVQADQPFPENKHLGVINNPDVVGQACDFEQYGLNVGDSCYTKLGLPNFTNYNLAPLGPFRMNGGSDKVICINDTSQHGVTIGSPVVAGITYQWISEEIDSADRSLPQITVKPDSTTWYYIEITDSSYSGSCTNSYIDSVLVEVKECSMVGIPQIESVNALVYPNPAKGRLNVLIPGDLNKVKFRLFTLLGEMKKQVDLQQRDQVDISDLSPGVYIYQIEHAGSLSNGKVVIE